MVFASSKGFYILCWMAKAASVGPFAKIHPAAFWDIALLVDVTT